jgi:hypothetical protein
MKLKERIAEIVAKIALSFAKEAAGAASMYGFYLRIYHFSDHLHSSSIVSVFVTNN